MIVKTENSLHLEVLPFEHTILSTLGRGGEGIAYLIQTLPFGQKYVVKVFHQPHERIWSDALIIYEQRVDAPDLGLPPVTLLGNNEVIQAVIYPHTPLHKIHWRILYNFDTIAKTLFGFFCRTQYFLMANYGICLLDPGTDNFMMDQCGQFHFIDFGWQLRKIDHPRIMREGKFGYALAMLLLDIYHQNIKQTILPASGYPYDKPCIYFDIEPLDNLAKRYAWVNSVVEEVRRNNSQAFHNPEFYLKLSDGLPDKVFAPRLVTLLGNSMRSIGNFTRKAD